MDTYLWYLDHCQIMAVLCVFFDQDGGVAARIKEQFFFQWKRESFRFYFILLQSACVCVHHFEL